MKNPCPYFEFLHIEEVSKRDGTARLVLPFRKELTNPNGFVHGGAIASLADAAMAVALVSLLGHGEFLTAKIELKFKSPSSGKTLICDSKIESNRGNFHFGSAVVKEEDGRIVAEAQASFSVPTTSKK